MNTTQRDDGKNESGSRIPWLYLTGLFFLSRVTILLAGYYSNLRIEKFKYFQKQGHFTDPFFQWDSYFYLSIARSGYWYVAGEPSNVHFFPLYPLLVRLAGSLTGEFVVTGFILANLFLFGAMVFLYQLVRIDGGGAAAAERATLYLAVFPTGFFLSLFYPESLYLMLSLAAIYYARIRCWWGASLCGGLLAITKTPGVFIFVPIAMEYLGVERDRFWPWRWNRPRWSIVWLGLIPLGLLAYMCFLFLQFGDFFAFSKATATWGRKVVSVSQTLHNALQYPLFEQILYYGVVLLALLCLLAGYVVKIRLSYLIYGAMLLLLFSSANILESIQRHVLMIFPIYMVLGWLGARSRLADLAIIMLSLMLLTLYTVVFVAGYRMY
jgi:hypothetical protein